MKRFLICCFAALAALTTKAEEPVLLFGKFPQKNHAQFMVKAVSFVGNDSAGSYYRDSEDITGTIAEMYRGTMSFLNRNLQPAQSQPKTSPKPAPKH